MEKMDNLFEKVQMDIETEDMCTQDIEHTFMTLYYQDDSSIVRYTLFFREDDPISIA